MLYLDVNKRALSGLPWCPAIMTAWFCVQFVLDILPICSACISLVILYDAVTPCQTLHPWLESKRMLPVLPAQVQHDCCFGSQEPRARCLRCATLENISDIFSALPRQLSKRCRATFPEMKANPLYDLSRYRSHTCRERNVTSLHFCHTCSDASLFTAVCSSHRVIPWKVRMRKGRAKQD